MAVNDRMLLLIIVLFQLIIYWTNAATINDDIINMIDQSIARSNQQKGDSLINQRTELRNITRKLWAAHDTKAERVGGDTNHTIAGDLKDIKRRLRAHNLVADYYNYLGENDETGSYFDDEIEYFTDEILDEWIDNLSYDEAMYVYNLLNKDESGYSDYDSYYDEYYSRVPEQEFKVTLSSSSTKKKKISEFNKFCKVDGTLKRFNQEFKKGDKIKICKPAPSVMLIHTKSEYTPRFSPEKEYKIKGLAVYCNNLPVDSNNPPQYYIRFTDHSTPTTHLISVKNFRKLISESGKMQFVNGNTIKKTNTNAATPPIPNPPSATKPPTSATKPPTPAPAKRCVALSGGGIRAAMGSFLFLNKLESLGKLDKVKCISAISGGTWGLIMWLFKNPNEDIKTSISTSGYPWGPYAGLSNFVKSGTPYEQWSAEIKKHIFNITSLKDQTVLLNQVKEKLKVKFPNAGANGMTVYFVADSVDTKSKSKSSWTRPKTKTKTKSTDYLTDFIERCWFVVSTGTTKNYFTCSTDTTHYDLEKAVMKTNEGEYRKVELLDVLTFCSAAWAMEKAHSKMRFIGLRPTTDIFRIYTDANWDGNVAHIVAGMDYKPWRLIDAGGTLNIPVSPYLTNDKYKMQNGYEIWVIGMSKWINKLTDKDREKKKERGIPTKQMEKKLKDVMRIVECSDSELVRYDTCTGEQARDGVTGCDLTIFTYVYDNRKIKLLPLYGKTKKWELIDEYPTKIGTTVKQWDNTETKTFIEEWKGHLQNSNWAESF
eukprot:160678_1